MIEKVHFKVQNELVVRLTHVLTKIIPFQKNVKIESNTKVRTLLILKVLEKNLIFLMKIWIKEHEEMIFGYQRHVVRVLRRKLH